MYFSYNAVEPYQADVDPFFYSGVSSTMGGGSRTELSIINLALNQPKLSKCLATYFGSAVVLNSQSAPSINTGKTSTELGQYTDSSWSDVSGTPEQPVPARGQGNGTVLIANDYWNSASTTDVQLQGTYLHETANILAYQLFTNVRYTQRPFQGELGGAPSYEQLHNTDRDPDIGAQFEKCVFGAYKPK